MSERDLTAAVQGREPPPHVMPSTCLLRCPRTRHSRTSWETDVLWPAVPEFPVVNFLSDTDKTFCCAR